MTTYRNPVHDGYFADPFVLRWDGRYLAYGTGGMVDGLVFEVLESADLVTWKSVGGAMKPLAEELGTDYWAPEVVEAAFDAGWLLDPNGYLAPVAVMVTATEDD